MFFREAKLADTYFDREIEQAFMTASKTIYQQKTLPYLLLAQRVGNMYTSSLYGGLVSYLIRSVFVLVIIYLYMDQKFVPSIVCQCCFVYQHFDASG